MGHSQAFKDTYSSLQSQSHLRDPRPHLGCLEKAPSEQWGTHVNTPVRRPALPALLRVQGHTALGGDSSGGGTRSWPPLR